MQSLESPYIDFVREEWCGSAACQQVKMTEEELVRIRGFNEVVSMEEVERLYWPVAQLLHLYIMSSAALHQDTGALLGYAAPKVPYIIGVAGSVAVGKSTASRLLQSLLQQWDAHQQVDIIPTDAFLYPNQVLESKGIMNRKGFPESYDLGQLLRVLQQLKSGVSEVAVPVYSHHHYDIVPDVEHRLSGPDVVIVEGLNILQTGLSHNREQPALFVSDFLDFGLFVDAPLSLLKQWYIERVLAFCESSFQQSDAYFHHLSQQSPSEVTMFASEIWHTINELNLQQNILPFKNRSNMILVKGAGHVVENILLRKI